MDCYPGPTDRLTRLVRALVFTVLMSVMLTVAGTATTDIAWHEAAAATPHPGMP